MKRMKTVKMAKNTEKTQAELYREQRKARLAKAAAKKAKKSKKISLSKGAKSTIAILIAVAIVAGIAGYAVSASGIQNRRKMVLNIGGGIAEVSQAEYSFYYSSVFNQYFNTGYQYAYSYGEETAAAVLGGYDYKTAPDQQKYKEKLEGYENPTWADYFESSSIDTIRRIKALNKLAADENIALDEEDYTEIDAFMDQLEEAAANNNFSVPAYLKANYGEGVSKKLVRKIVEEQTLASKYEEFKREEFGKAIKDDEILKEYKKDTKSYDKVGIAYYLVKAETVKEKDKDGKETTKVTDKTMAEAKKSAQKLTKSDSLDALSSAVDKLAGKADSLIKISATDHETISYNINEDIAKWIYGKNVKVGDMKIFEVKDTGYYVCYVTATPFRDDILPISVRHILINFAEEKKEETTDKKDDTSTTTTTAATTEPAEEKIDDTKFPALDTFKDAPLDMQITADKAKQPDTYKKAELILREFLSGDRTADSFAALATANTNDTESKQTGGLYENVVLGQMVEEFNDWCFDKDRKTGDVGIVETTYGYHIMYFVGQSAEEPVWKSTIRATMGADEFVDFADKNISEEKVPVEKLNVEALEEAEEFTLKLARRYVASVAASGY